MTDTKPARGGRLSASAAPRDLITLTRPQAAALCGLTPAGFDVWVRKGIVPPTITGTRRWSRVAVERAVAGGPNAVDVEVDPYEREMANHRNRRAAIAEWHDQDLGRPLGMRERSALLDIWAGGGRTMQPIEVRGGPATHSKLRGRGFLVGKGDLYELKLTPEGLTAALAIQP